MRRLADVLIEELFNDIGGPGSRVEAAKTALDVKVINAVGPDRRDATRVDPV